MGSSAEQIMRKKVDEDRLKGTYLCPGEDDFGWNRRTAVI